MKNFLIGLSIGLFFLLIFNFFNFQRLPVKEQKTSAQPIQNPTQKSSYNQQRLVWKEKLNWPEHCEKAYLDNLPYREKDYSGLQEYKLDGEKTLVILNCQFLAYQGTNYIYIFDKATQHKQIVSLPYFRNDSGFHLSSSIETLGFLKFDPKTKNLTLFAKSRGVGGCGYSGEYMLKNNSFFELIKARAYDCDNSPKQESEWPIIYEDPL